MLKTPFPDVGIGDALRHDSLTVFPLFATDARPVDYILARDAIGEKLMTVRELDENGVVGTVRVQNRGEKRVLLLEGELLAGAKQNRVMNTSVLVPAYSTLEVPVSCVERGRWRKRSDEFSMFRRMVHPTLRRSLKRSVATSLCSMGTFESAQGEVWDDIRDTAELHGVRSKTEALSDVMKKLGKKADKTRTALPYVDGATGFAVVNDRTLVGLECFDRPETCRVAWEQSIPGWQLDARAKPEEPMGVTAEEMESIIGTIAEGPWRSFEAIGDGEEVRSQSLLGFTASALVLDGALVHASAVS